MLLRYNFFNAYFSVLKDCVFIDGYSILVRLLGMVLVVYCLI